ncbi:MAG: PAS domain S-box protein, partial [Acetobacteraceae bacterium]|nr:PAS domain S-box protein [Acetobacteraceae bacterium]
ESVRDYAISMLDPEGNVATWNAGADRIKGWKAEEIIGQHFSKFYPQEALDRGWPAHELQVAAQEGRFEDENWRLRKDGSRFWANVVITALRNSADQLVGFAKVTRDLTERKQAEDRLRKANANLEAQVEQRTAEVERERQRLQVTLASIGDAVIAVDAENRITFLNAVAQHLTGWPANQALGRPLETVFSVINEQTRRPVEHPVAQVRQSGSVVGLANHTLLVAKDGTERPIEDSAAPIMDEEGLTQGVVLVFRDATSQRVAERLQADLQGELERQVRERTTELRASEERFRLLVEGTTDYAIFMLDPQGHIASWNPGAQRLKGWTAQEIIGQHFSRFYPQEAIERAWPQHELRVAAQVGRFEDEGWRVRKDGSQFWANVVITALKDEQGNLLGFSKITRDLTQRKQAEEDARHLAAEQAARQTAEENAEIIRAQREQFRITLESIGDAVIVTDAQANVTLFNPVAEGLTGWKTEEAIGQPLGRVLDLKNEQTGNPAENPVDRVMREGVVVGLANHTLLRSRDGTERAIDDSAAPIRDSHGNLHGCVMVFHDVSERRRAEEALRRQAEHLQEQARLLDIAPVLVRDFDGPIHRWNAGMADLYGFNAAEAIGQSSHSLLHTEFPQPLDEINATLLREGRWHGELVHRHKDGSRVVVASHWALHRGEGGGPVRVLEANNNITGQKEAEAGLRLRMERLRLLNESAAHLLHAQNADEMVRGLFQRVKDHLGVDAYFNFMVNEAGDALRLESCAGITEQEAATITRLEFGQAICGTVALERRPIVATSIQQSDDPKAQLARGFGIDSYACTPLLTDDALIGTLSFASRARGHFDEDELEFIRTLCNYVTVAYERLRLVKELRQADRRKDEFLAMLAHELRNPLAPIRNALQILRMRNT